MHPFTVVRPLALALLFAASGLAGARPSAEIRVDVDQPGAPLGPLLYGLFFEDINHGADGGLYAELLQNRSFEYHPRSKPEHDALFAWEKVEQGGARVRLDVSAGNPIHPNNPHHLDLAVEGEAEGAGGVRNLGFNGIRIDAGARYDVSLHARATGWTGSAELTVSLELPDGRSAGSIVLGPVRGDWTRLEGVLRSDHSADDARLVVTTSGRGRLSLDMVSLFPQDTWRGRKQGLRKDLVQALHDLRPGFLRFPGGCIAHGSGLANQYRWKDSVGDIAERKANWNLWGYHQTYGLGYFEYFQLCEDLGATPLPVIPVGVSCGFQAPGVECVPMADLPAYIQDALDLVEFATGPVDSTWGSVRARMGHPAPFDLRYVCLGNEEHDTPEMRERFPHFVRAFREKYPHLKLIGNSGLSSDIPLYEMMAREGLHSSDEHYYELPEWFLGRQRRFDAFPRGGPKVFIGEYASWGNHVFSALAEAAYLTGVERNADLVEMTAYAPLFGRIGHTQWNPNLLYFDQRRVLRTANYHVQRLFSLNRGDVYLKNSVRAEGAFPPRLIHGRLGVGSASAAVEIASIQVDEKPVDLAAWSAQAGRFDLAGEVLAQPDPALKSGLLLSPAPASSDTYSYRVRARKTAGQNGSLFLLLGADARGQGGYLWTLGADNNRRQLLQQVRAHDHWSKLQLATAPGALEDGVWHDLLVRVEPDRIRCDVDGRTVLDHAFYPHPIGVSASLDRASDEIILKLVNPHATAVDARITVAGSGALGPRGRITSLGGALDAENSFDQPGRVLPADADIPVAPEFSHVVPAASLQIIRIPRAAASVSVP